MEECRYIDNLIKIIWCALLSTCTKTVPLISIAHLSGWLKKLALNHSVSVETAAMAHESDVTRVLPPQTNRRHASTRAWATFITTQTRPFKTQFSWNHLSSPSAYVVLRSRERVSSFVVISHNRLETVYSRPCLLALNVFRGYVSSASLIAVTYPCARGSLTIERELWRHGNGSHPTLAPIMRQFRSRARAYAIIGVLLVSRGPGHVWREAS